MHAFAVVSAGFAARATSSLKSTVAKVYPARVEMP
jgi:hypothetical protein